MEDCPDLTGPLFGVTTFCVVVRGAGLEEMYIGNLVQSLMAKTLRVRLSL